MHSQVIEPAAANRDAEYSLCNFDPDSEIPNHPKLPVMIWRGVVSSEAGDDASKIMAGGVREHGEYSITSTSIPMRTKYCV